jgi:protein TonB
MHSMKNALIASSLALLFGCNVLPMFTPKPTVVATPQPTANASPSTSPVLSALNESQASHLDAYKIDVAQHILSANAAHTFSGRLPPMLPAIVIVNISLDGNGNVAKAVVQRSRDHEASRVALASVLRAAPYPKPARLLHTHSKLLEFSETFLFNADYRFQLRTLAGPQ